MAPVWTVPRTDAQPMPHSRAPEIASATARFMATGPGAACASTIAMAARGRSTVGTASGADSPLSNSSRYRGTRETPCESMPRRLAQTSASATAPASGSRTPRAAKMPLTRVRRSSAATRTLAGDDVSAGMSPAPFRQLLGQDHVDDGTLAAADRGYGLFQAGRQVPGRGDREARGARGGGHRGRVGLGG